MRRLLAVAGVCVVLLCAARAEDGPAALQKLSQDFWAWRAGTQPFNTDRTARTAS